MEKNNDNLSLKIKWSYFFKTVFDPWVLSLLATTIVLICLMNTEKFQILAPVLSLFLSLISGLLGGIISNRWSQMTETKVLVVRGKSAVRSLKLILLSVANVSARTKTYIKNVDESNKEYKLIKSNFEEVIVKCNTIEEEIISSIENWTDIIPEVENLKTQIGLISDFKLQLLHLEEEKLALTEALSKTQEEDNKKVADLQKQLNEKESDLVKIKEKLSEAEGKINTTVLSGLTSSSFDVGYSGYSGSLSNPIMRSCSNCHAQYFSFGFDNGLCPMCTAKEGKPK